MPDAVQDREPEDREPEDHKPEAVCFTAGPKGAAFGVGVIHAWLASARPHPLVAAGISSGTLTAAAMQRSYRELAKVPAGSAREAARWTWFRCYLRAISVRPLESIWRAFPDPVDFTADQPPVKDESCPHNLGKAQAQARRHYHILTRFGVWMANVPVRVSSVASLVVHFVRSKEGYGGRLNNWYWLAISGLRISGGLWWNVVRRPKFYRESNFRYEEVKDGAPHPKQRRFFHPLFGWRTWLVSILLGLSLLMPPFALLAAALGEWREIFLDNPFGVRVFALFLTVDVVILLAIVGIAFSDNARGQILLVLSKHFFSQMDLSRNLLHPYHLQRRLQELFGEGVLVGHDPMDLLLVSACLQSPHRLHYGTPDKLLVEQLLAGLAIPGIFPPVRPANRDIDLIDGVAIRQNPLPALFDWLKENKKRNREVAAALEHHHNSSIFVVYNVPIEPYDPKPGEGEDPIDIVEAAFASAELAKRRDTRQEVRQTNDTARLARCSTAPSKFLKISAQEIAPPRDITFKNPWDPQPREILSAAATGCKAALERLYRTEIASYAGASGTIDCAALLNILAPERKDFITLASPGVPEMCAECSRMLERCPDTDPNAPPPGVVRSFGIPGIQAGAPSHDDFVRARLAPLLSDGRHGRIVFVASGGVFRGAFHIGTIGALHAARIKPDLIVGASVGALMGGALAAISSQTDGAQALDLLHDLAGVFLRIDREVALTRSFKNAAKQLGVRARKIDLAPSEVRRMVLAGGQADAGFAAAGAPPALIDAISGLFLIPHQKTTAIAGDFVAGHFADAVKHFLEQVRCETLPSLDIERALIGVTLLEGVARRLLGEHHGIPTKQVQPYRDHQIAFFATTSYLNRRMSIVLGRDFLRADPSYDFIMAGLSSSAFPSVFAPRTESDVVPGRGKNDVYFADGGMFDNLPFLPAIEILQKVQCSQRSGEWSCDHDPTPADIDQVLDHLEFRRGHRDIFIAAGLDADPGPAAAEYDTLVKVYGRAGALASNSKIDSFLGYFKRTHEQVDSMLRHRDDLRRELVKASREDRTARLKCLDEVVDAAVLKIVPASPDHINGTFAFCRSTGMSVERVQRSIADGCYQTLLEICKQSATPAFHALARSQTRLTPRDGTPASPTECAWFTIKGGLKCPFAEAIAKRDQKVEKDIVTIRSVCSQDSAHEPLASKAR